MVSGPRPAPYTYHIPRNRRASDANRARRAAREGFVHRHRSFLIPDSGVSFVFCQFSFSEPKVLPRYQVEVGRRFLGFLVSVL